MPLAHKHCNECYYAPGKGSDCTPEVSDTLKCCGDSHACTIGGEFCACETNAGKETGFISQQTTTNYQVQVDLFISCDINKFKRVDLWSLYAPACSSMFKEYYPDNYCFNNSNVMSGSIFHQIELQDDDDHPYVKTKISSPAPASGKIVWAQSHLQTGGVNATLRYKWEDYLLCRNSIRNRYERRNKCRK